MATCKECLHYEACVLNEAYWVKHNADQACHAFKDKSQYVEQKHGQWKVEKDKAHTNCTCSACHMRFYYFNQGQLQIDQMPYCPNCGAKMGREA